jgi:hypothetical protein
MKRLRKQVRERAQAVERAAPPGVRELRVDAVGGEQVVAEITVRKLVEGELIE